MISLAMPTYNGEKYIEAQLDSIYNQTMIPDEVIVVDDRSTDGTVAILDRYRQKYGLKYYVNERNLGYNLNFEKAISLCSGDYIALCDQDDVWLPDKIEKSYMKIIEYPQEIPALVSSFNSKDISILETGQGRKMKNRDWKYNFALYTSQGCTLMFNRKLKEIALPIPSQIMYDAYLGFVASLTGNRFYIGEQMMYYRIHEGNAYAQKADKSLLSIIKRNLHKYIPLWFGVKRYHAIKDVRNRFQETTPPEKLKYVDTILSLYEVNKIRRIFILCRIKEIPLMLRIGSVFLLIIKILFIINDTE